jgi:ribonuclease HIII
VLVRPEQAGLLTRLTVVDSKLAGDQRIRQTEGVLLAELTCAVRVLPPEEYNAAWEEVRNVNVLLGRLHAELLGEVLEQAPDPGVCRIVVDKFGDPKHVTKHLPAHAKKAAFTMITGGEREPAVAAASFLARAAFLRGFDALRADAGTDLPLGSSDPRIVPAPRGRPAVAPQVRQAPFQDDDPGAVVGLPSSGQPASPGGGQFSPFRGSGAVRRSRTGALARAARSARGAP